MFSPRQRTVSFLFLTLKPETCNTLSVATFKPPVNPGQHPTIPEGSTGRQAASIRKEPEERFNKFLTCDQTDKALKSLLITAADDSCVRSSHRKYVEYANVKTKTILKHSHDSHARIIPTDLEENNKRLKGPCDPNQTFETLIDQVEDAIEHAAAGKDSCAPRQIVSIACMLLFNTGVHHNDCKTWRQKLISEQT